MDENMRNIIASVKAVIETTRGQLEAMEKEPDPDRQLMAAVQDNYERAMATLRTLKKINGAAAVATVEPAQPSTPETTEADEPINVTRHVDHAFQVIPPAELDEHPVNEQALEPPAESYPTAKPVSEPATSHATQSPASTSAAADPEAPVHMTRAQYRKMLKKQKKHK